MANTITTVAGAVGINGFSAPAFADIFAYAIAQYEAANGIDSEVGPSTQDGQILAMFAKAANDFNALAAAIMASFSPATAVGVALSNNVKLNNLQRLVASNSTVDLTIGGVAGTTITNGFAADAAGNQWDLPATVVIPPAGTIVVTATCQALGAITAPIGSVNQIGTPTLNWQTVTNLTAGAPGAPVEDDPELRIRQSISTMDAAAGGLFQTIVGDIAKLPGVLRIQPYENPFNVTDSNGIPSHSISLVIEGGDAQSIANTLLNEKTLGAGTYGTTQETAVDSYGIPHIMQFFRPSFVQINYTIIIKALTGYTSAIGIEFQQGLVDWTNSQPIGTPVFYFEAAGTASLLATADGKTFEIKSFLINSVAADAAILFNQAAMTSLPQITLTVQ